MVWAHILFCLYKRNKKFYNSVKIDKDSQFVPLDFEDLSTRRAGRSSIGRLVPTWLWRLKTQIKVQYGKMQDYNFTDSNIS